MPPEHLQHPASLLRWAWDAFSTTTTSQAPNGRLGNTLWMLSRRTLRWRWRPFAQTLSALPANWDIAGGSEDPIKPQHPLFKYIYILRGSTWTWILERILFNPLHSISPYPILCPFVVTHSFDSHPIVWLLFSKGCLPVAQAEACRSARLFLLLLPLAIDEEGLVPDCQRLRETGSRPSNWILVDSQQWICTCEWAQPGITELPDCQARCE